MENTLTISLTMNNKIRSVTVDEDSSWPVLLNETMALLQNPDGYSISREKLVSWAKTTETPLTGDINE